MPVRTGGPDTRTESIYVVRPIATATEGACDGHE